MQNVGVTLWLTDFTFQDNGRIVQSHEKLSDEVVVQDGNCQRQACGLGCNSGHRRLGEGRLDSTTAGADLLKSCCLSLTLAEAGTMAIISHFQ